MNQEPKKKHQPKKKKKSSGKLKMLSVFLGLAAFILSVVAPFYIPLILIMFTFYKTYERFISFLEHRRNWRYKKKMYKLILRNENRDKKRRYKALRSLPRNRAEIEPNELRELQIVLGENETNHLNKLYSNWYR